MPKSRVRKGRRPFRPAAAVVGGPAGSAAGGLGLGVHSLWESPRPTVGRAPATVSMYGVRVDLVGARPPIWRRLELAGDIRLDRVHRVLQVAMGWENDHLHAFRREGDDWGAHFIAEDPVDLGEDGIRESSVRLDQVLADVGDVLRYEYDFGDGWQHTVRVEQVRPREPGDRPARCLGGRRACPPEDIGGIGRYEWVVASLAGGPDAEPVDEELLDWLPEDFDPMRFDVTRADADLGGLLPS